MKNASDYLAYVKLTRPGEHLTVGTLGRPGRWLCRGDGIKYVHRTQEMVK